MATRFTAVGEARLEQLIEGQLRGIRDSLLSLLPERQLDALVLGGGYGRGEGGALDTPQGQRPYNDYDLVLVHHVCDRRRLERVLGQVHREQTARCGVHVDVTPLRRDRVSRLPPALTWYELGQGHVVLWGKASVLDPLRARRLDQVCASEWGRLLFNRGTGLLYSRWLREGHRCRVVGSDQQAVFVTRQVQKAWLSLGDVWLADRGQYHHLVQERRARWLELAALGQVPAWSAEYLRAVDFKLRPVLVLPEPELLSSLEQLSLLYADALSSRLCARPRFGVGLYATVRHLPVALWLRSRPTRYPRERLREALVSELRGDSTARKRLVGSREKFVALWQRYG